MRALIIWVVVYFVLGLCYAIDFFHSEYENMVGDRGTNAGEFFIVTILTGLLWPLCMIMFAIMDIRDER